jgi:hypothetical protein
MRRGSVTPICVFNGFCNRSDDNELLDGFNALYAAVHVSLWRYWPYEPASSIALIVFLNPRILSTRIRL